MNHPGFDAQSILVRERIAVMTGRFTEAERARAVRLYRENRPRFDSKMQALRAVADQVGCSAEAVRGWEEQDRVDAGQLDGVPSEVAAELRTLRKQNAELAQELEIVKAAATFFARECDPPRM